MALRPDLPAASGDAPLLRVERLRTWLPMREGLGAGRGVVKAVDDVTFDARRGMTLGIVGESGCGKTTLARTILRLIGATAGRVEFDGVDWLAVPHRRLALLRRQMQIIFQDPASSLNPRFTVEWLVGESLTVHGLARGRTERRERVAAMLERVGLSRDDLDRYPHEFSGGQRQRIGIARALVLGPRLLICDEPVSALDVSIQSQVLNLLAELQRELSLTYLLISHNLAVVRHACDEVAVMYLGRIIEQSPAGALFERPLHPYTRALLDAAPRIARSAPASIPLRLAGEPPSPVDPPSGCALHPRCPFVQERCRAERPELRTVEGQRLVACHFAESVADASA